MTTLMNQQCYQCFLDWIRQHHDLPFFSKVVKRHSHEVLQNLTATKKSLMNETEKCACAESVYSLWLLKIVQA